ncbi:MAG TPA: alpha/beta hydrolase [Ktedonobacterales bacterium]|nr:alpha/beta hydrolase [Ktedonobacterales bacterium]
MQVTYRSESQGDWGLFQSVPGVETTQEWLTMNDGTRLFCRVWRANSPATLLILHGLGAHSAWFIDMGNALAARGLNVWVVDHRGFGRSEGPRGHVTDYRRYLQDIDAVVEAIRAAQPETRLFLLGHSMGGIFATYYAADHPKNAAGLLLLNPWIKDQSKVSVGTLLAVLTRGVFKSPRPFAVAGGPDVMTTNPEAVKLLNADPYWVRAESASFLLQITLMRGKVLSQARRVTLPALVLQASKDLSVVASASEEAFRRLGSADKTWKAYPTYAHDSEFEADRSALDDDIADWIKARIGQPGS